MATREWSTWWLRLIVAVAALSTWWQLVNSQPQTTLLGYGCSSVPPKNKTAFFNHLSTTFSDLRDKLSGGERFATLQPANSSADADPVFAMFQCRNYMSEADCSACYDLAVSKIRECNTSTGARVTFDGCFLRYEGYNFFQKSNENALMCGNTAATQSTQFAAAGQTLLKDLEIATPKMNGFSAATKRKVSNDGNLTIYGAAQCVQTISQAGCQGCMTAAYEALQACLYSAEARLTDAGCFMRFSDTPFFADNQTTDLTPFLRNPSKNRAAIWGVVGGAGLAIILVILLLWYMFTRKLKIATRGDILGATELPRPNRYSYKDLKEATNNFSEENKLGQGGFGVVYKATLKNRTIVAVKKLDMSYRRAKAEFETEVRLISNVHHRNLVRLLGCCRKGPELLLVYEYMQNGSLDRFLYGDRRGSLTWKQRLDIFLGTARGIAYLHENYHVTIIHRDIKPSNILLDDEFQAKIADFGLARLLPENHTHVSTNFAGTLGYTAPEYAINGHLSEKVDIYSFGVVILEIISGRRCNDVNTNSDSGYLLREAWKLYERGMHQNLSDEALDSNEFEAQDLKKMVEIALICTQSPASSRPTMSEILAMILSDQSVELRALNRPSFDYENGVNGNNASKSSGASATSATVSISHFTGR